MNVQKLVAVALLGVVLIFSAACGPSGEPTPTRTPKAVAENNPTQTPWIIYIPITTTPEPETATPLPTVTSANPTREPTNTRAPTDTREPTNTREPSATPRASATPRPTATQRPTTATVPTASAPTQVITAAAPTASAPTAGPSACGQTYAVGKLTFPKDGDTRVAKAGTGQAHTIQFKWELPGGLPLTDTGDPKIGYQINITAPGNGAVVYISHNGYLRQGFAILNQQATYGLTLPKHEDVTVHWNVTVVHASLGFNDPAGTAEGTVTACGPTSASSAILLHVEQ